MIDFNEHKKSMPKEIYAKGGFGPKKQLKSGEVNLVINENLGTRLTSANPRDGRTKETSY